MTLTTCRSNDTPRTFVWTASVEAHPREGRMLQSRSGDGALVADRQGLHNGLRPNSSLSRRPPARASIAWPGFRADSLRAAVAMREVALRLT